MTKEEKIAILTKELLDVINSPDEQGNNLSESDNLAARCNKTINELHQLNVDTNIVRQIMRRVDEVYGKADNYKLTKPLYEEFTRIIKELE